MSLNMLGSIGVAGPYGDLYGSLFSTAGNLGEGIMKAVDADKAEKEASSRDKSALDAAITADLAASSALAAALASAAFAKDERGQALAQANKMAADIALSTQDVAGAKVPAALVPQRVDKAQAQLAAAVAKLQAAPGDAYAQGLVKAWTQTLNKAQNGQIVKSAPDGPRQQVQEGWLTQKGLLGLPNYGVVAGGAGLAGAVWYAVKKGLFAKLLG